MDKESKKPVILHRINTTAERLVEIMRRRFPEIDEIEMSAAEEFVRRAMQ